jgi:hypothetical protein
MRVELTPLPQARAVGASARDVTRPRPGRNMQGKAHSHREERSEPCRR